MQRLNYYQLFCELASRYPDKEIVIEISSFNRFAGKIRSHNIICDFDYCDLEDYARSLPEITHIEYVRGAVIFKDIVIDTLECEEITLTLGNKLILVFGTL